MFIKPQNEKTEIPYSKVLQLGSMTPVADADQFIQDIQKQYRGIEYFPDDTSHFLMYFGEDLMRQFRVRLDWNGFISKRVVEILNIDELTDGICDYIMPKNEDSTRFDRDIYAALYKEMIRVYVIAEVSRTITDVTSLPCYNEFTTFSTETSVDMTKVKKVDMDSVYIIYE